MLEFIKDFSKDGKCSSCGNCCSNLLPMTKSEIARIKKYIAVHKIKKQNKNFPTPESMNDLYCPFRNEKERKCNIYEARPEICRVFMCNVTVDTYVPLSKDAQEKAIIVNVKETFYK